MGSSIVRIRTQNPRKPTYTPRAPIVYRNTCGTYMFWPYATIYSKIHAKMLYDSTSHMTAVLLPQFASGKPESRPVILCRMSAQVPHSLRSLLTWGTTVVSRDETLYACWLVWVVSTVLKCWHDWCIDEGHTNMVYLPWLWSWYLDEGDTNTVYLPCFW